MKPGIVTIREKQLSELAKKLFRPVGKNPYYLKGKAINNLEELARNLGEFTGGEETKWVASWLEYLGDTDTAGKIRGAPNKFKQIITDRYYELRRYR